MDYVTPFSCNCQNRSTYDACPSTGSSCTNSSSMSKAKNCGCGDYTSEDSLSGMPLAMAYVPWQSWRNVYDAQTGLRKGTIFGELIFPFLYASPACRESGCHDRRRGDCK